MAVLNGGAAAAVDVVVVAAIVFAGIIKNVKPSHQVSWVICQLDDGTQ